MADLFEDGLKVRRRGEAEDAFAELSGGEDLSREKRFGFAGGVEVEMLSRLDFAAGADERRPIFTAKVLSEQDFDASAGVRGIVLGVQAGAGCVKARRDHAAVVEDEQVAGAENLGEVAKEVVAVFTGEPVQAEHSAGAADGRRRLGYKFFRKIEMEVGYTHWLLF